MKCIISVFTLLLSINLIAQDQTDSSRVIYAWELQNFYSTPIEVNIDTNLPNFQVIYPIYTYSINNSFLGNFGSAVIQNNFTDRIFVNDAFFLNPYLPYLSTSDNTKFFNTKKPFSRLTYTNSGPSRNREESFEIFHTQNTSTKLNFGFRYHAISAKGQYRYLQVKRHAFRIFGSYTGSKYMLHTAFNLNRYRAGESAGINDSIFRNKSYDYIKEYPSVFEGTGQPKYESNAENRIRYYDFLLSQRLKLFTLSAKIDSTNPDKGGTFAEPIITYALKINRTTKTYDDIDPVGPGFYNVTYFNKQYTLDSITHFKLSNTLQLEFKTVLRGKVQTSIYGMIGYDYETYSFVSDWDTNYFADTTIAHTPYVPENGDTLKGVNRRDYINNTYISAGIYGNFWNRVKARFFATVYVAGQKFGNTKFGGIFNSNLPIFGREYEFDVSGTIENKIPGYLLNNYYSNHYIWEQDILPEYRMHLSSKLGAPSNKFELRGNYYFIRNYIYFNNQAVPENYRHYEKIFIEHFRAHVFFTTYFI
ncbi:hypothetical protein ES705_17892 [subsurface metagenome]